MSFINMSYSTFICVQSIQVFQLVSTVFILINAHLPINVHPHDLKIKSTIMHVHYMIIKKYNNKQPSPL